MSNAIQIFNFQNNQIRVVEKDGEPWWVLKDVCDILCLSNPSIVASRLDSDEVTKSGLGGLSGESNIVNESGLYNVIIRSDKPEAKAFKRWITHEVLPTIRKHGGYLTPAKLEEVLLKPDTLIKLALNLKEEQEKRAELEAKVEADAPKILFADSVSASYTDILIGDLAKLLRQNGCDIGQNRLFLYLRDAGFLMKNGASKNMPTQRSMEQGLFRVKESTVNMPDGAIRVTKTTKVTGKGQIFFINHFLKEKILL